eukprot:Skav201688  [mRNA]  locus=scaffold641:631391:635667:- [translate_table: standard]
MSPDTWSLVKQKQDWRKLLRQTNALQRKFQLQIGLGHWRRRLRRNRFAPVLLYFHAFSGRRRHHDFHHWLKELGRQRGYEIKILSLDTAVNQALGDLSRGADSWSKVCRCLQDGAVAGSLLGPPCETYSEARHNEPPADVECPWRWPRPLRSCERILGLEGLSGKELRQLSVGTAFLFQALRVLVLHSLWGGYAVVEHPGPPSIATRASAWSTSMVEILKRCPGTALHVLHQWRWGAKACKPTGFLVHALPSFIRSMWARRDLAATYPLTEAIGCNAQGQFRTSELKEYPSGLCYALAATFLDQTQQDLAAGRSFALAQLPADVEAWIQEVTNVSSTVHSNAAMRPDYQGS